MGISKRDINEYAKFHKLKWVEDESNRDNNISRNFIRNKLLPKVKENWPNVQKSILHLSSEAIRTNKILKSLAEEDLKKISSNKTSYDLNRYLSLSTERAENLLYFLINYELGLEVSSNYLKEINKSLQNSNKLESIDFVLTG